MLPAAVTSIGTYAFYNTQSLTTIGFNYLLTSIGNYAFHSSGVNSVYYSEVKNYKTCKMSIGSYNTPVSTEANWKYGTCGHRASAYSYASQSGHSYHTRTKVCHYCNTVLETTTNLAHTKKYSHVTGAGGDASHHVWCDTEPSWVTSCSCGTISRHHTFTGCAYDVAAETHSYSSGKCTLCKHTCVHSSQYTVFTSNDKQHSRYDVCNYCDLDNRNPASEDHSYVSGTGSTCTTKRNGVTCGQRIKR